MLPQWRFKPAEFEVDGENPQIALEPWAGHRQFAYDYLRNIRPRVVVELGTKHGCAFFSFCQAAKDDGLDWTRFYAVDNWLGNEHDSFYGEEVIDTFLAVSKTCFSDLNIYPVRKQFVDAVPDFMDESIDLLHIDGLHTYEAVTEDYSSWLPKLNAESVVFIHDVHTERHGTTRFWREMTDKHPSLLFEHCFGLGLLFPKGDKLYHHLRNQGLPTLAPFYTRIGLLEMELAQARSVERRQAVAAQEDRLRLAEMEAKSQKEQATIWWRAAMDAQWKLDCLKKDGFSGS